MTNISDADDRATKWIRRIARIWSSPIIVFSLIMFAGYAWNMVTIGEADPYAVEGYPLVEALPPILMFLSVLGLGIAWRWEKLGGTITLVFLSATFLLLLIQTPITQDFYRSAIPYLMTVVIAIPGILFLVSSSRSRRMPDHQNLA
ncbi:MAG: hypothetical protein KAR65_04055 [Anaerolineales bacterium]|nr:hypothetical protein [Anaerolineales bacterium]MCK5635403.1 hypothetical protein [Anaerolineales bacterium]